MVRVVAVGKYIKDKGAVFTMKPEKWYQRRLAKYFTDYYEAYEDTAEYWNDPAINQWLFDIPELGLRIELTCSDRGIVTEQRYRLQGADK